MSGDRGWAQPAEWAELPEGPLLTVLDQLEWGRRESAAVRRMCSRWRRIHDGGRRTLSLSVRATDDAVVALCARMTALTEVNLSHSKSLTDEGLRAVAELKSLTVLDIGQCSLVTDEGLKLVAGLPLLTELILFECHLVTDQGVRAVAEPKSLTCLNIGRCDVTDEGVRVAAELPSLSELNLYGCSNVTDAGLRHLHALKELSFLSLTYCDTSKAAEEELRRQIPGLYIEHFRVARELR